MNSQKLNHGTPHPSGDAKSKPASLMGDDLDEKFQGAHCTQTEQQHDGAYIPPEEIQARFSLLRDLSAEQMNDLNKRVVRKIDWRLLPIVSLMYLMKSVFQTTNR